ncbi:MAG TPA: alpha/beta fold hydrolase [Thermoanaerobaculia bacterium]|nr:alpha/beta fold hydrolase [Thermoanaerobaculia bacterium]
MTTPTDHENKLSLSYVEAIPKGRSATDIMPIVITLHGRGSNGSDLAGLAPSVDGGPGYRFICPDAPKPFYAGPGMAYGFTWFDGWPPSAESFAESRSLLLKFISEVLNQYPNDGRVALIGFSQGSMMALDLAFRLKPVPSAVVAMSGAVNEFTVPDTIEQPAPPILLLHGTQDDVIPVVYARKTRRILEDRGVTPEYQEFPMGHWVTEESMALVKEFLGKAFGAL